LENVHWEKLVANLVKQGILYSSNVIAALRNVPRIKFMPTESQSYAAADSPLPIGFGQTISAPHMVSIMNEALKLQVGHRVLEVGAGSGWHAATIADLVGAKSAPRSEWGHVYTVEIVSALAEQAKRNILSAGFGDRVTIICGDGSKGFAEKAPYDRIVVTGAVPEVPKPLIEQLKSGGIMVIPVGDVSLFQSLIRVTKKLDGEIKRENLGAVAFVPLIGKIGQNA
jgi:protein-L-isoaspartate(D-aspartate) O-methyltransferase